MRKAFLEKRNQPLGYKIICRLLLILIVSISSISCNNLPPDLQAKRKACSVEYEKLIAREDTVKMDWEYDKLITDYAKLKKDVITYTSESNKRGFPSNNDEILKGINQKIAHFEKISKPIEEYSNYGTSSSGSYSSGKSCSWCGKSFSGEHYTHLGKMSDCYSTNSTTSIGIYCSRKCCSEARRSSCPTCR